MVGLYTIVPRIIQVSQSANAGLPDFVSREEVGERRERERWRKREIEREKERRDREIEREKRER